MTTETRPPPLAAEGPVGGAARTWRRFMRWLADYHSWELVGAGHVPKRGGAIVTCTHSLATYDLFIMGYASQHLIGRQAYIIGDDLMFRIPGLTPVLEEIAIIPGGREAAVARLKQGYLLGIAPGGMKESLRGKHRRREFDWSDRRGFVWAAALAGVPIVPAVCPSANDIYSVYENPLTEWAYRRFKLPLPIFRGLGPTPLPRPTKLLSVLGPPIYPDVAPDRVTDGDVTRFHARVVQATQALMVQADLLDGRAIGDDVRRLPREESLR
jgi:1-acyl-sn-glycerol-3-phosphate acyltransferase